MIEINRYLDLSQLTARKSAFLFGPRGTGKSFWIQKNLQGVHIIDLLHSRARRRFIEDPSLLEDILNKIPHDQLVVIDEIQMVPELLDEVHRLIEKSGRKFLLTGNSARKLKRFGANMLGGRASKMDFTSLTWKELNDAGIFDLDKFLLFGGLPRVYQSGFPSDELSDYVDTYLDQEIKAEAITRNIHGFEKFLQKIALSSGEVLVYANIAADINLTAPTVRQYIEVLEDTLLGYHLPPWSGPKRKAIQSSRFFLFDLGLKWHLSGIEVLEEKTNLYGQAFEQFIIQEVRAKQIYTRSRKPLYFWRTTHQDEVDLIIDDELAIEIKSKHKTSRKDAKGLLKLRDEGFTGKLAVVSKDPITRSKDDIEYLYWQDFFTELWRSPH